MGHTLQHFGDEYDVLFWAGSHAQGPFSTVCRDRKRKKQRQIWDKSKAGHWIAVADYEILESMPRQSDREFGLTR